MATKICMFTLFSV